MGGFLDDHKWKLDGACRGERAEVFFEERYEAVALSFCARCPVVDPCFTPVSANSTVCGVGWCADG